MSKEIKKKKYRKILDLDSADSELVSDRVKYSVQPYP